MSRQIPWFRVAAEGAVIVLSILLAFAIDAWWDGRVERTQEREALRLIHADLVADSAAIDRAMNSPRGHLITANSLLQFWDDADAPRDSLEHAARWLFLLTTPTPQRAAFSNLRESTGLGLIRDDLLRSEIIEYFDEAQVQLAERWDRFFAERTQTIDALLPHVRWFRGEGFGPRNVGSVRLESEWAEVTRDNRIFNRLALLQATSALVVNVGERMTEQNSELRQAIAAELAGT